MSVREEFEKAFDKDHIGDDDLRYIPLVNQYEWTKAEKFESALWAAKWVAERCAKEVSGYLGRDVEPQDKIRQLAKELSQ